ncbi:MAG: acetylglutamate kinase [Chloroflexi bacterium]|nr:acetylglutamate kinase [Chloroflexota bacterium]
MVRPARRPVVVKIGGSTLGTHDTTIAELAALARDGLPLVIVHGGGKTITEWLARLGASTRFVRGLRVTDAPTLETVVAVLGGLVNTQIVAELAARGVPAVGLSGVDDGLFLVEPDDPDLGFVGRVVECNVGLVRQLLAAGRTPVIAPIGRGRASEQLYNLNGDTAAGVLARALGAERLVFLTEVAGVRGPDGALISTLTAAEAQRLIGQGVIAGGMIPKVEAGLAAGEAVIADGRAPGAVVAALQGTAGTVVRAVGA